MAKSNYNFKVVVGGAGGVGKTTLLHRYLHNEFLTDTTMTVGVDFHNKEVIKDGTKILLTIWDLGGQERFRFFQPSYCAGSRAAFIFFDLTMMSTALQVKDWAAMFRAHAAPNIPIILCGTKLDLATTEMLAEVNDYARSLVDELGLANYFATSSLTGENIEEMFDYIIELILQQGNEKPVASGFSYIQGENEE